jgi:hypothetical protein
MRTLSKKNMMAKKILFANIAANLLYCNSVFIYAPRSVTQTRPQLCKKKQEKK